MKKLIAILLTVILSLSPVTVLATSPLFDTTQLMMGDANEDKKVNAADARIVLRIAAKIEKQDIVDLHSVDADGNGTINASDARVVLRVAANISEFVYGYDENGIPCALNILKGDKYFLKAAYTDEATSSRISMSFAKQGDNLYLISDDMGFDMSEIGFSSCGMLLKDNKIYALLGNDKANIAMHIPDSLSAEMGMTKEEIMKISEMVTAFIPNELGSATRAYLDNQNVFCYSYKLAEQEFSLYVAENGKLISIKSGDTTLISFEEVAFDNTDKFFNLDNYDLM